MKKYPFSKKAVQAMLAAAIAFSPVASFGAVQAHAEGEYSIATLSTPELVNRLEDAYGDLTTQERAVLTTLRTKLDAINDNSWQSFIRNSATDAFKVKINNGVVDVNKYSEFLDAFADLAASDSISTLEDELDDFQREQSANVDYIFGSGVTVDDMLIFLTEFEVEFLKEFEKGNVNTGNFGLADLLNINVSYKTAINTVSLTGSIKAKEAAVALKTFYGNFDENLAAINLANMLFPTTGTGGGGGGGGGGTTPPPVIPPVIPPAQGEVTVPEGATETKTEGNTVVTEIPAAKVSEVVNLITAEKSVVPLTLAKPEAGQATKAEVPASLFTEAAKKNPDAAINVKTEEASYKLPASEINVADLAKELGVAAGDVQITVAVNVVEPTAAEVADFVKNNKPVSKIIEFEVKAVSGDKEVHVTTYRYFVDRVIKLDSAVSTSGVSASAGTKLNVNNLAGVRINEDGSFSPVPTIFNGDEATIKSLTNSKYTIVENSKTFTDIDNGKNFFEANIEKLASKYIINGKTADTYGPSADITRGEFAALITRSLGLVAKNPTEVKFPDVPTTKAVNKNGEINAAVEAGIIKGFTDGNFKPDQPMTRAEAAIMIDRAMNFTEVQDSKLDKTKKITGLADHDSISNTSRDSILKVYQAGIMGGFGNGEFGPYQNTKRDQMAKVLDKFLQISGMIN